MSLTSGWQERKEYLRRMGNQRPVWRLALMLAIVLYLIYKLRHIDQFLSP